jgi:uncharacterized protein (DUF885 family)
MDRLPTAHGSNLEIGRFANMKTKTLSALALLTAFVAGAETGWCDMASYEEKYTAIVESVGKRPDSARLHDLFETAWEQNLSERPEWATAVGRKEYNDRWRDLSTEAIERRKQSDHRQLQVLHSIDRDALSKDDRLNYDLFERERVLAIEEGRFPSEYLQISQMGGIQQGIASNLEYMPVDTRKDIENILARLEAVPRLIDQTAALLEEGLAAGITPPQTTLAEVPAQVNSQIVEPAVDAPMLEVFKNLPRFLTDEEKRDYQDRAVAIYKDAVVPAWKRFHTFLVDRYLPGCRESIAWRDLPRGPEWYAFLVRRYTTTDLSPDSVFNIGMSEVKRIRQRMDSVIEASGFEGDFGAFCDFLRTDPQFYFQNGDELVSAYRDICKRADPELIKLFGRLPRLPYGVRRVPSYAEKSQTTAYYEPGSLEAGRPGYYYVNTYDLSSRPKWEMEPLTLHEAVPGHHLQISLTQELENLPQFRRYGWITAYGEGWALYAESLGDEMGFYEDPYAKFGQLTYEMWRAIRLVVDVGMHYKGWTRQEAIDFFKDNSGKTEHDIEVEIDRYIVWPGQALAYKMGELKIKELRAYAEETLGEKFDLRSFHDEILGYGYLPLDVLDTRIRQWVATQE